LGLGGEWLQEFNENKSKIEEEIKTLREDRSIKFGEFLKSEYDKKRKEIIKEISEKKEDGAVKLLKLAFLKAMEIEYNKLQGVANG